MTSDKRQGSAWKKNMNKIPYSESQKHKTLDEYYKYCKCGNILCTEEEQRLGVCSGCR